MSDEEWHVSLPVPKEVGNGGSSPASSWSKSGIRINLNIYNTLGKASLEILLRVSFMPETLTLPTYNRHTGEVLDCVYDK